MSPSLSYEPPATVCQLYGPQLGRNAIGVSPVSSLPGGRAGINQARTPGSMKVPQRPAGRNTPGKPRGPGTRENPPA